MTTDHQLTVQVPADLLAAFELATREHDRLDEHGAPPGPFGDVNGASEAVDRLALDLADAVRESAWRAAEAWTWLEPRLRDPAA